MKFSDIPGKNDPVGGILPILGVALLTASSKLARRKTPENSTLRSASVQELAGMRQGRHKDTPAGVSSGCGVSAETPDSSRKVLCDNHHSPQRSDVGG
jgi:hypothetical protein